MRCRVYNCDSRQGNASKCSFFSFPADDAVARKWVEFCGQVKPFNLNSSSICMKHFTDDDYQNVMHFKTGLAKRPLLRRNAVPTVSVSTIPHDDNNMELPELVVLSESNTEYLPEDDMVDALTSSTHERNTEYLPEDDMVDASTSSIHESNTEYLPEDDMVEASTSSTHSGYYYDTNLQVEVLKKELETLKRENADLKKQNAKQSTELATLKRESALQQKRNAWEVELLQKSLNTMAAEVENVKYKITSILTKRQIAKLKDGSVRRNSAEEDIAQSILSFLD